MIACGTLPTDGAIILRLLYVHSIGFIGHAGKMLQTRTFSTSAQTEGNYTRVFFFGPSKRGYFTRKCDLSRFFDTYHALRLLAMSFIPTTRTPKLDTGVCRAVQGIVQYAGFRFIRCFLVLTRSSGYCPMAPSSRTGVVVWGKKKI